jgi:hypothetical protein
MSGQPYKRITDVEKFRNQYLNNLNLRTQLDDTVHQAVKNYKATGALPAVSQMKDNRTTSEKLADTERLKVELAGSLAKVSSLQFGDAVVQRIISSPLNQDNSLLIFASQRINDIVERLSRIYTYGIKGDTNDIQQIVNFIAKMYEDKNSLANSTRDFLNNNINSNIGGFTAGGNQFSKTLSTIEGLKSKLKEISNYLVYENILEDEQRRRIQNIITVIDILRHILPRDIFFMSAIDNYIIKFNINTPDRRLYDIVISYKDYITTNIPNITNINIIYNKLIKYFDEVRKSMPGLINQRMIVDYNDREDIIDNEAINKLELLEKSFALNMKSLTEALVNLEGVIIPSTEWNINTIQELYKNIRDSDVFRVVRQGVEDGEIDDVNFSDDSNIPQQPVVNQPILNQPDNNRDLVNPGQQQRARQINNLVDEMYDAFDMYNMDQWLELINQVSERYNIPNDGEDITPEMIKELLINDPDYNVGQIAVGGLGLRSKIITKGNNKISKRGRGRPKGSGIKKKYAETVNSSISNSGIEPERRFIKFGRYLLNTKKLNDGILAIKRPSGNGIAEFPSQRISNNFRKVVKIMIGGGNPSFGDLEVLSEPERLYLHKLASKADIVDKFNIPTPSKTKYEQDIHEFEVMKGEIMSGNDSKELIKKFKLHILKLSKLGALPKAEVHDILETLVELGY